VSVYETDVEWELVRVKVRDSDGSVNWENFCKAWKSGHPGLVGYGIDLPDAIAAMLNKHGE
jgi:hypothetical protein